MKLTNVSNIPLSLAVWLANDEYDHSSDPDTISVTTLLKPMKAIVLARQNVDLMKVGDVSSLIPSRIGTALHDSIEKSWRNKDKVINSLESLNYSSSLAARVAINPNKQYLKDNQDCIPIYMEIRSKTKVGKYTITGKFDFCAEGCLEDFKSTSTYGYITGSNTQDYIMQGSMYRWLNPYIITEDTLQISYIFTDWSGVKAKQDKSYPQSRMIAKSYPLMGIPETDQWVKSVVSTIDSLMGSSQDLLPQCNKTELWQKADVWKYYKNPDKKTKSTRNFSTEGDALTLLAKDGNVGVIDKYPGEVVRCRYCNVCDICDQAQGYVASGLLKL